jgi:hypothetical protein
MVARIPNISIGPEGNRADGRGVTTRAFVCRPAAPRPATIKMPTQYQVATCIPSSFLHASVLQRYEEWLAERKIKRQHGERVRGIF